MVDIQSATAEIRRGKKNDRKKDRKKPQGKNIMSASATQGCHKQQYVLHMSLQYGELRPTNGWDRFGSSEHPSKFQRVSRLAFVTAATSLTGGQPNFARCLAVSWAGSLDIQFRRLLPPWQNFSRCKIHFTSKSCVRLYWQRYCTALRQRASADLWASYREWNYGTFAKDATYIRQGGHHVGHRPTF